MKNTIKKLFAVIAISVLAAVTPLSASAANVRNFTDVASSQWYYTAVEYAVGEGLFSGTSATTFCPNGAMTRGMFVRVLGNKAGVDPAEYPTTSFTDVKLGDWYTPCVEWAAENNIVNGIGGRKFAPNRSVTREQMAVILYNYAKYADCDLTTRAGMLEKFSDGCKTSSYAKYAMEWAITHGILNGSDGKLNPLGTATRAQVAQIFYNSRELLDADGLKPAEPTPTPTTTPEPTPVPTPSPDEPKISITDEVRAKLKPNQDPEKILDYVLNGKHDDPTFAYDGTTAKWDPSLGGSEDAARCYWGSWTEEESDMRSSSVIGNGFLQMLTRTDSDRFYISAEEVDGCFCLYYHPAEKPDSLKMKAVKAALHIPVTKKLDRSLCYDGAGWAGPLSWELYGGADGIADKINYYLNDLHPYTTRFYITEPEPDVFYLLFG